MSVAVVADIVAVEASSGAISIHLDEKGRAPGPPPGGPDSRFSLSITNLHLPVERRDEYRLMWPARITWFATVTMLLLGAIYAK